MRCWIEEAEIDCLTCRKDILLVIITTVRCCEIFRIAIRLEIEFHGDGRESENSLKYQPVPKPASGSVRPSLWTLIIAVVSL